MRKNRYTKEEIREFYQKQRDRWKASKDLVNTDECRAILREMAAQGIDNVSPTSIIFVVSQLKELGLPGLPFVDVKTFQGWKEIGMCVRKGEKAILTGVSWKPTERKNPETGELQQDHDGRLLAKSYSLFHKSQVKAIEELEIDAENEVREAMQD